MTKQCNLKGCLGGHLKNKYISNYQVRPGIRDWVVQSWVWDNEIIVGVKFRPRRMMAGACGWGAPIDPNFQILHNFTPYYTPCQVVLCVYNACKHIRTGRRGHSGFEDFPSLVSTAKSFIVVFFFSLSLSVLSLLSTITCNITKGSLEVKLPTIWRNEEQRWEESERRREEETRIKKEKESEERRCRCAKR